MTHPLFGGIQRGHGLTGKVLQLEQMLERLRNRVGLLGSRTAFAEATEADLAEIESRLETLAARVSSAPAIHLDGEEAWKSLAAALVAVARERTALRTSAVDLLELIVEHSTLDQHRREWRKRGAQQIAGLLRYEREVRKLIEAEGVDFWDEQLDEHWRIVDTRWLVAHGDMFRWVIGPWGGGRRCRYCAMTENPSINTLRPVELERRNGYTRLGDIIVLDAGASALTHERCRDRWLALLTTIAPYRSVQEAEAADRKAGRKSRWVDARTSPRNLAAPQEASA